MNSEPGMVTNEVYDELGHVARQLHSAVMQLGQDGHLQRMASDIPDARERLQYVGQLTERAGGSWDRLETLFEQRVAKAMHRLGWPSADDVAALHARITALEQALANTKPTKTAAPSKRQATNPPVAKRPATQRVATQGLVAKTAKPVAKPTRTASRSTRSPQR